MTLDSAKQLLDGFLRHLAPELGVQRLDRLIYTRPANDAAALLSFPCRIDPRGPGCFGCNVGLRFESLARFLHGAEARPTIPTVTMPLHLLRENKTFTEWQFYGTDDLDRLRTGVITDLTKLAVPFIEQYSKLSELRRKLESPMPEDWFVLGPEQRVNVLAVTQFVQGDRADAMKTLDDALLKRKMALPGQRLPIEVVHKRLAEAG